MASATRLLHKMGLVGPSLVYKLRVGTQQSLLTYYKGVFLERTGLINSKNICPTGGTAEAGSFL